MFLAWSRWKFHPAKRKKSGTSCRRICRNSGRQRRSSDPQTRMNTGFRNRTEAGRLLAEKLAAYAGRDDVVVLALPRGGVPVGFEVARALGAPLDVFVVRKLGLPWHEELAMGALASGGVRILDDELVRLYKVDARQIDAITRREQAELERREAQYRGKRPFPDVRGKTAILVDDGLAT